VLWPVPEKLQRTPVAHTSPKRKRGPAFSRVCSSLALRVSVAFFLEQAISCGCALLQQSSTSCRGERAWKVTRRGPCHEYRTPETGGGCRPPYRHRNTVDPGRAVQAECDAVFSRCLDQTDRHDPCVGIHARRPLDRGGDWISSPTPRPVATRRNRARCAGRILPGAVSGDYRLSHVAEPPEGCYTRQSADTPAGSPADRATGVPGRRRFWHADCRRAWRSCPGGDDAGRQRAGQPARSDPDAGTAKFDSPLRPESNNRQGVVALACG